MALQIKLCKIFHKSLKGLDKLVLKKLMEFQNFKALHPNEPFGSSDKPYSKSGNFSGYWHAHLTFDMVVNYKISGNVLYMYGVFSHDDLGIGQPANKNKQKSMGDKFNNQIFERQNEFDCTSS